MNEGEFINVATAIMGKLLQRLGSVTMQISALEPYDDGDAENGPYLVSGEWCIEIMYPDDLMYTIGITEDVNDAPLDEFEYYDQCVGRIGPRIGCELPPAPNFIVGIILPFLSDAHVSTNPFMPVRVQEHSNIRISWIR